MEWLTPFSYPGNLIRFQFWALRLLVDLTWMLMVILICRFVLLCIVHTLKNFNINLVFIVVCYCYNLSLLLKFCFCPFPWLHWAHRPQLLLEKCIESDFKVVWRKKNAKKSFSHSDMFGGLVLKILFSQTCTSIRYPWAIRLKTTFLVHWIIFAFHKKWACLYVTFQEVVSSTPQAEMDLSRNRVSAFLASHTAYELLPESGKVCILCLPLEFRCTIEKWNEISLQVVHILIL